ncbi:MAG: PaaI family thioesterase [Deltaproteobacteria bacterium]|nr:PaaI family thioesterase [Deltaproteobacteria bacterium]MBW1951042.1 PaaI family thioesterase [Deltaproteobacteria bacterium]MBW2347403.1 PaaI family thioesterase [Deltaproteobacteria bacterium]
MRPESSRGVKDLFDAETMRKVVESSPFFHFLGMELLEVGEGSATLQLPVAPHHINTQGIVHGGVLSSLADTAGAVALGTRMSPGQRPRTVQMDIHYLSAARGQTLTAVGSVAKSGGKLLVADIDIADETGTAVATARITCVLVGGFADERFTPREPPEKGKR